MIKTTPFQKNSYKLLIIFALLLLPWISADYMDEISSEKITSDLGFYGSNPCKISLFEFIIKNPNVMYQDHYFINTYEYSSISCFGKYLELLKLNFILL